MSATEYSGVISNVQATSSHVKVQRFLERVRKTETCWIWMGGKSGDGYGYIYDGGKGSGRHLRAHRVAFELFVGPIPEGKQVLHHCDNPACVSPNHLFLGTELDNARDRNAKDRDRHPRGECVGTAKLTQAQVQEIRAQYRRYSHEFGSIELGRRYGVSHTTILDVAKGKFWRVRPHA
jgi:hypothetical protein